MIIAKDSHLDHGITDAQRDYLIKRFRDKKDFFVETVTLPAYLGRVPCELHGPLMGDKPIKEPEVFYVERGDRKYASRLCRRKPHQVNCITVIAGPYGDNPCVLYTAYGGPIAPREPDDPGLESEADRAKSVEFWAEHALSIEADDA